MGIIASLSKNEGCFRNFKFTYQKMSYESRSKHDSLTATLNAETQRVKIITSQPLIASNVMDTLKCIILCNNLLFVEL